MVFSDPETGDLLAAAEYLSGNVIVKLERAREAAATDDAFTENVHALEQVIPTPLGADEIEPQIGAVWISPEDYAQFLSELIEAPVSVSNPYGTIWDVRAVSNFRAISEWGTRRVPAARILETSLKQQVVTVVDDVDGTRVPNPTATEEAREKQAAMQERFAEWVWEGPLGPRGWWGVQPALQRHRAARLHQGRGAVAAAGPGAIVHPAPAPAGRGGPHHQRASRWPVP